MYAMPLYLPLPPSASEQYPTIYKYLHTLQPKPMTAAVNGNFIPANINAPSIEGWFSI
jgi:hypothetical protein